MIRHQRLVTADKYLEAVLDQENIDIPGANRKRKKDEDKDRQTGRQPLAPKTLLPRIATQHTYVDEADGHIVKKIKRKIKPKKPRLAQHEELEEIDCW